MAHPRVDQLRFARSEWIRGLRGLTEEDARRRLEPMNSISWMVGHLAWHERLISIERGLGLTVEPDLDAVANGAPASTPSFSAMLEIWQRVTGQADAYLDTLATPDLVMPLAHDQRPQAPSAGSQLQRITYHYWSHIGEASAIRQLLGHPDLPQFVGRIEAEAPYRPEDEGENGR